MGIYNLKGRISSDIWELGTSKSLPKDLWKRSRFLLEIMNSSTSAKNLQIKGSPPDIRLHKLKGDLKNHWSVTIHKTSGWRIVFRFDKGEFHDVQIIDYHEG